MISLTVTVCPGTRRAAADWYERGACLRIAAAIRAGGRGRFEDDTPSRKAGTPDFIAPELEPWGKP